MPMRFVCLDPCPSSCLRLIINYHLLANHVYLPLSLCYN